MFDFIRKRINKTIKDASDAIPEEELEENMQETGDVDNMDENATEQTESTDDIREEKKSHFNFFRRNKDETEEETPETDDANKDAREKTEDMQEENTRETPEKIEEKPKEEKKSHFNFFRRNKDKPEEEKTPEADDADENIMEQAENINAEDVKEEKKGHFNFFRRNKDEPKKEEETDENAAEDEIKNEDNIAETENNDRTEEASEAAYEDNEEESSDEEENKGHFGFLKRNKKEENMDDNEDSGRFSFITKKTIKEDDIEDILEELELSLIEGDVAFDVADKIVSDVKEDLVGRKIKRRGDMELFTTNALKKSIREIIDNGYYDLLGDIEASKQKGEPYKIMFVGINGTGKTTTIAKLATYLEKHGYSSVFGASDTFRAGAIEQLEHHAKNLNLKIIRHERNSDPAAVAFDAVEHARATNKDVVLIDTSGRMQTNANLMDEMKKIKRVSKPDIVVYVGDALMGNDATEQASKFNEVIDIDGIILTKADADAKGGAAISIGHAIHKPILFVGTGQSYDDLMEFKPDWMINQIFEEEAAA